MASNTSNNRIAIKWIRDKAKSAYIKMPCCHICAATEDLELHHTNSLTNLFEKWCKEKGYSTDTDEEVLAIRDEFIDTHHRQIYEEVFTLCNKHHVALHRVYGKSPPLHTTTKQNSWVEKQKAKAEGRTEVLETKKSFFGAFI